MLSKPVFEYWLMIRSRTLSASSSFLNCSLGLSGSRSPSAHWPWLLVGRGDVMRQISFDGVAGVDRANHRWLVPAAQIREPAGTQVVGSTKSSQTATAAYTLEVDVTARHQRNAVLAVVGDGHPTIV